MIEATSQGIRLVWRQVRQPGLSHRHRLDSRQTQERDDGTNPAPARP